MVGTKICWPKYSTKRKLQMLMVSSISDVLSQNKKITISQAVILTPLGVRPSQKFRLQRGQPSSVYAAELPGKISRLYLKPLEIHEFGTFPLELQCHCEEKPSSSSISQ